MNAFGWPPNCVGSPTVMPLPTKIGRTAMTDRISKQARPRVVIVVVNYNSAQLVLDCVQSLQQIHSELKQHSRCELLIVDGGSTDHSADILQGKLSELAVGEGTQLLRLDENGGFAFANNAAIKFTCASPAGAPDYFWLLNPDTIVRPGALAGLLSIIGEQPRAGIVGSKLLYANSRFQHSAFRFPSVWSEFQGGLQMGLLDRFLPSGLVPLDERTTPHHADWVSGASFLIRSDVIRDIGLLDDHYFLYFEEVDFCARARDRGWEIWWTPTSNVVHLVGQSSGVDTTGRQDRERASRRRPPYWFHSRRRFFDKRYSIAGRFLADAAWLLGHGLLRLRTVLLRQPNRLEMCLISDFVRFTYFTGAKH